MDHGRNVVEPRSGPAGAWDRFVGPGATNAELVLELVAALGGAILVPAYAIWQGLGWTSLQLVVASILALDLFGGVVVNATAAAKRWYHRPGQGFRQHFGFVLVHLHPFLVAWLFMDGNWAFGLLIYGYLLLATLLILRARLYLQRPLAMLLMLVGLLIGLYVVDPPAGLEWFVPVFYLKLLVSHLLKEAPFPAAD